LPGLLIRARRAGAIIVLHSLGLNRTQVSDVAPLAGLIVLQSLGLHRTQVSDVTPLTKLTTLQKLDPAKS
jgi:hypothetical protein